MSNRKEAESDFAFAPPTDHENALRAAQYHALLAIHDELRGLRADIARDTPLAEAALEVDQLRGALAEIERRCEVGGLYGLIDVPRKALRDRCTAPPEGWTCSRLEGHYGPCAATPTTRAEGEPHGPA